MSCYEKAASSGHVASMVNLGRLYEQGRGTKVDYTQAARQYQLAASSGSADGQCALAQLYRDAAEQGHAHAQFFLGLMCQYGQGVNTDFGRARHWCERSADRSDRDAQFHLAQLYDEGLGCEANRTKAIRWYQKSSA